MSNNINYAYNVEYFEGLKQEGKDEKGLTFALGTVKAPDTYSFIVKKQNVELENSQEFELATAYPGLLIGTGYMHDLSSKDAVKCGFTFDFVTGLPYLPGSSLKGTLRSYFPEKKENKKNMSKAGMIRQLLGKPELTYADIEALRNDIFEYNDVFLDAFPVNECGARLIENEYITPHSSPVKDPNPIHVIKVKPNVVFKFKFLLSDYLKDGVVVVSASEKLELFRKIILLMGVGAKTNVGFGKFCEKDKMPAEKVSANRVASSNGGNSRAQVAWTPGHCKKCGKPTRVNQKTNQYYNYCYDCKQ